MNKTILVQIIKKLPPSQLKSWLNFCESPYHLTNTKLRKLAQFLHSHAPDWEHTGLQKKKVWAKLYADRPYRETSMNNYISDLLKATYSFLAHEQLKQNEEETFALQMQALIDLGLVLPAQRVLKKWQGRWTDNPEQGTAALRTRYQIANFEDTLGLMGSRRQHTVALQRKSLLLDQYYALEQLTNYCNMLSRQNIVQGQYELPYLDEIFRRVAAQEAQLHDQPAIKIYMALAQLLLVEQTAEHFNILEELLGKYPKVLPTDERRSVYNFLLNYCVQRINLGEAHYYQKVLAIYRSLLAEKLLLRDQQLSQWTYTNIITSGSRLKAWEWTENFIEEYRSYLPPQDQYNAYHYNWAALRYEQGDYDKALQGLHQIEFTDAFYHLAAKTIQLKIYYQKEATDSFQALLFATRQFVSRNRQLSTIKKKAYLNFLKLARRLFELCYQRPYWDREKWQQRSDKLRERLDNSSYTANNKDWIREELDRL